MMRHFRGHFNVREQNYICKQSKSILSIKNVLKTFQALLRGSNSPNQPFNNKPSIVVLPNLFLLFNKH